MRPSVYLRALTAAVAFGAVFAASTPASAKHAPSAPRVEPGSVHVSIERVRLRAATARRNARQDL